MDNKNRGSNCGNERNETKTSAKQVKSDDCAENTRTNSKSTDKSNSK